MNHPAGRSGALLRAVILGIVLLSSVGTAAAGSPLSAFTSVIPEMIVAYADAAALMLANLERGHAMSRHRVGLALPVGMRGSKP